MKFTVFGILGVFVLTVSILAQVSPVPVADAEVRDSNSIRMRSLELERAKREANKPLTAETSNLNAFIFAAIKEDFENIQELQATIVKTYTTGAKIDFERIGDLAFEMKKRAIRLRVNLFETSEATDKNKSSKFTEQKSLRDLIIELDSTLADFVGNPLFTNTQVISAKSSDNAKADLEKLIRLSSELRETAEKMDR